MKSCNVVLEAVVIDLGGERLDHAAPHRLHDVDAVRVVAARELEDLGVTEQLGEARLKQFQMCANSRAGHHAFGVDRLEVESAALTGADGAGEAGAGEYSSGGCNARRRWIAS